MPIDDEEELFYPGSQRVRRSMGGDAPALPEAPAEQWENLGKRYLSDNGAVETFYPISALAIALGRRPMTMRHWERDNQLPVAPLRSVSSSMRGRRRMYTHAQVVGLQQIAKEEGLMSGTRVYVTRTAFAARAHKLFRELEESE